MAGPPVALLVHVLLGPDGRRCDGALGLLSLGRAPDLESKSSYDFTSRVSRKTTVEKISRALLSPGKTTLEQLAIPPRLPGISRTHADDWTPPCFYRLCAPWSRPPPSWMVTTRCPSRRTARRVVHHAGLPALRPTALTSSMHFSASSARGGSMADRRPGGGSMADRRPGGGRQEGR
jgi:hypothetical protein